MKQYDHQKIEKKWQKRWEELRLYSAKEDKKKPKKYVLDMFPYPSGEGLHVGHPKGYIATDVFSRHARMQGNEVLHPMGWDAFGLPAENFAIKNKIHPRAAVEKNIARFKQQLRMIGLDYDWEREINTTDPGFYRWTQWIFLKLLEKGLAYESNEPINWCPTCQTGLSNEDLEGNACERCGTLVEKRPMRQWVLKITDYADRLLDDLSLLPEWQEHIKESQRNWIGRSEGAEIDFPLVGVDKAKRVLILHGRNGSPDNYVFPWLKAELEKRGYEVEVPALPNTDEPNDEEQADYVEKHCTLNEDTVIIAQSFGGIVAMRLLERGHSVNRVVMAVVPHSGTFNDGKTRASVTAACKKGFDFATIKRNAKSFIVLRDATDEIVPAEDADLWQNKLGGLHIDGVGVVPHFSGDKEPDMLLASVPTVRVFTTRPDTLFGATYLVLAPEHPWVTLALKHGNVLKNTDEVNAYVESARQKTELERMTGEKEKTGVRLEGVEAINPATGGKIPLYVADYVLAHYGTGAIMAVPAHDERDFDFARKFDLPITQVVAPVVHASGDRSDAVHEGEQFLERTPVMCIVKHWDKDEYLCIQWKDRPEVRSFVSGGIEEGESPVEAGKREILEETGYTNTRFIRQVGGFSWVEFYHQLKKTNIRAKFRYLYFELENGEQAAVSAEEQKLHDVVWKQPDDVLDFISLMEKERVWNAFVSQEEKPYVGDGKLVNSDSYDGMTVEEAKKRFTEQFGRKKTTYKIRDWVFSRQRYWGEPIPVIHCPRCGVVPVPEKDLPVTLPDVEHYEPSGTGESPLANMTDWVNVMCPQCGDAGKRETNTMPQWAGSSWYYLRYMDPNNTVMLVDPQKEAYWAPVDLYVGGAEHATRHLIYARFWHKFLFDLGIVSTPEPFTRLISVGLIQAEDGRKMSKRYGNVINPDDIVERFGADTLRVYEMFMGPFTDAIAWNTNSLVGARRFLERVWRAQEFVQQEDVDALQPVLHKTIKKVGDDIAAFKFNTAVSQLMILLNAIEKEKKIGTKQWEAFVQLLAPFAPHVAEELWTSADGKVSLSVHVSLWPEYDPKYLQEDRVMLAIQINGKTRGEVEVASDAPTEEMELAAREAIQERISGRQIARTVVVPGRLVNFVLE